MRMKTDTVTVTIDGPEWLAEKAREAVRSKFPVKRIESRPAEDGQVRWLVTIALPTPDAIEAFNKDLRRQWGVPPGGCKR